MKKLFGIALPLVLAAGACTRSAPVEPGGGSPTPTSTPIATAPASPTAPATREVTIYYLIGSGTDLWLAPERHRVPVTTRIATRALEELVHGTAQDPDHFTPFPNKARINSVTIANGVATVDWSAEVLEASAGSTTESLGIQSVVWTLTEFTSIRRVRFTVEGKDRGAASNGRTIEDWWGHVTLSGQPWDRDPAIDVLEPITLWTPLDGARSTGTLELTGEASTFEANVGIVLRDAAGREVVRTSTTAAEGAPGRGEFSKTITFTLPASRQTWTLEVFETSAKDGSITFLEDRKIEIV